MTDKQGYSPNEQGIEDTQQLLEGMHMSPEGAFELEDILAEFGVGDGEHPQPQPEFLSEPEPETGPEPGASPEETGELLRGLVEGLPEGLIDELMEDGFWDRFLAGGTQGSGMALDEPTREFLLRRARATGKLPRQDSPSASPRLKPEGRKSRSGPVPEPKPETSAGVRSMPEPRPGPGLETHPDPRPDPGPALQEQGGEGPGLSMEDIVASTVDAVKEQRARKEAQFLTRLEKLRKKADRGTVKKRPPMRRPPPDAQEDEPSPSETASWHRRRYKVCRQCLMAALPVLVLLWLPWAMARSGVAMPFFSESADNAAFCVLVPQAMLCVLCWPVSRTAIEGLRERSWTACAMALLTTVVTLLDEMTLLLLPQRSDVPPLGGVAAVLMVSSLWGLTGYHRGMAETLRTAAMGAPSRLADCCEAGIAKGAGGVRGFYARLTMEDSGTQWQRLLLPLLAVASAVFAVLSSVGQGRGQDLLWCWSAISCASSSLVFPLVYCVPFGRLAMRLARNGAAVAGQYGAAMLASDPRLVITDGDLFPQGAAALNGLKPYGEERERAISYAATLAVQGGGLLGRIFEDLCRSEDIEYQELEHFHVHEDNGLSGMIHGETVLLGTAAFMRHMAVRLPAALPGKAPVCLAVDGQLTAVFAVRYTATDAVTAALQSLRRNGLQLTLAVRDGNVTTKLLRARFGVDGGASVPELSERLSLSDPEREVGGPNGLLYRDGLLPFVSLVAGSRRLCQTVRVGDLLSVLGSVSGMLLGFYLTFTGSYGVLSPMLLLTYLLLWVVPMLPLVWGVDKL